MMDLYIIIAKLEETTTLVWYQEMKGTLIMPILIMMLVTILKDFLQISIILHLVTPIIIIKEGQLVVIIN